MGRRRTALRTALESNVPFRISQLRDDVSTRPAAAGPSGVRVTLPEAHSHARRCREEHRAWRHDEPKEHAMGSTDTSSNGAPPQQASEGVGNQSLAALSNELVRIYKDQFGRGPTKVRSHFAGPDTIVCLLENTFTPAEKSLQGMGEHQRL